MVYYHLTELIALGHIQSNEFYWFGYCRVHTHGVGALSRPANYENNNMVMFEMYLQLFSTPKK